MPDSSREHASKEILDAFAGQYEPLTTGEVVQRVDDAPQVVYNTLYRLADRGLVESKRVNGRVRVWWRPPTADNSSTASGHTADTSVDHAAGTATEFEPPADPRFEPPADPSGDSPASAERPSMGDVLQASPISTAVFDRSGTVSFANERAVTLLGLDRTGDGSQRYTAPEWRLYRDDGTELPLRDHPITHIFETGEPRYGFEHWIALPDGTERWVWGNATPITDPAGLVEFVVVGFADVTALKEREEKLTSDRRRRVELSSTQLFEPFLEIADGPFRVAVDEVVVLPDGAALEYLTAEGLPTNALTDILEQNDAVRTVRLLRSKGDSCSLEVKVSTPTVPTVFDEFGGEVHTLVERTEGSPKLVAELPGDVEVRDAVRSARHVYPDLDLESQELRYSPRLLSDIVRERLTERKFAVLQTAYHGGYFETPRESTGDELAEQFGITRQTFNQHLRTAEQLVFEQLFEASAEGKR